MSAIFYGQNKPSSGSWSPLTQGTLIAWYDASQLSYSNGQNLGISGTSPITDKSASGTYSQTNDQGGGYPTFTTNAQNSLAVFAASGTQYTDVGGPSGSALPTTVACVVNPTGLPASGATTRYCIIGGQNNSTVPWEVAINHAGNVTIDQCPASIYGSFPYAQSTGTVTAGSYNRIVVVMGASTWAIYINGSASGSGSYSPSLSGGLQANLFIERSYGATSNGFVGNVGEIEVYSSALGSTDITSVNSYLLAKWASL